MNTSIWGNIKSFDSQILPSRISVAEDFIKNIQKRRIFVICGSAGIGKTFFVKYLSDKMSNDYEFIWLNNHYLSASLLEDVESIIDAHNKIYVIDDFDSLTLEVKEQIFIKFLETINVKLIIISRGKDLIHLTDHVRDRISSLGYWVELEGMTKSDIGFLLSEYNETNINERDIERLLNIFKGNPVIILMCLQSNLLDDPQFKNIIERYKGGRNFLEDDSLLNSLLQLTAHQKYQKGEYVESLNLFKQLLEKALKSSDVRDVVTYYNNIANVYQTIGDSENALCYYEKTLDIIKKSNIQDNSIIATIYNNVGGIFDAKGEIFEAEDYYYKSLALREKLQDNLEIANSYSNIAGINFQTNDFDKALTLYYKALEVRIRLLGEAHPDVAVTYNNIGSVYEHMGNDEKAMEYYIMALKIYEKSLGTEHPDVAFTYNNMAFIYAAKRDYAKALDLYKKANSIFENVFGENHPYKGALGANIIDIEMKQKMNY